MEQLKDLGLIYIMLPINLDSMMEKTLFFHQNLRSR